MIKFLALGAALALGLAGCSREVHDDPAPENIRYIRDARTGLCFAVLEVKYGYGYGLGLANVPCAAVNTKEPAQ